MLGDQRRGELARSLLRLRAARRAIFPRELFTEHGWTMLLHLFAAQVANETLSTEKLVGKVEVAAPVGHRWLRHLAADGQVVVGQDGADVTLTEAAANGMRSFLDAAMIIVAVDPMQD